ncbi:rhodanese-like domain-containing protein [Atopobium fossor]|uniref:rhodanese-like domain-containing protein n=1 Tax=Atopobium fossor TaxID=39487 RepID=UPI0004125D90|nr:rhodanese-like domain-containing protein [Atopobium fossor]
MKSISMAAFAQLPQDIINVIDVREVLEYKLGHIPGAVNMPLSGLQTSYTKLDPAISYYLVCRSGSRSGKAAQFLAIRGYDVTNVEGGMLAWKGAVQR